MLAYLIVTLILQGCATPERILVPIRPPRPPAALMEPCSQGPDYPTEATVSELVEIVRHREIAAAMCRAKLAELQRLVESMSDP